MRSYELLVYLLPWQLDDIHKHKSLLLRHNNSAELKSIIIQKCCLQPTSSLKQLAWNNDATRIFCMVYTLKWTPFVQHYTHDNPKMTLHNSHVRPKYGVFLVDIWNTIVNIFVLKFLRKKCLLYIDIYNYISRNHPQEILVTFISLHRNMMCFVTLWGDCHTRMNWLTNNVCNKRLFVNGKSTVQKLSSNIIIHLSP